MLSGATKSCMTSKDRPTAPRSAAVLLCRSAPVASPFAAGYLRSTTTTRRVVLSSPRHIVSAFFPVRDCGGAEFRFREGSLVQLRLSGSASVPKSRAAFFKQCSTRDYALRLVDGPRGRAARRGRPYPVSHADSVAAPGGPQHFGKSPRCADADDAAANVLGKLCHAYVLAVARHQQMSISLRDMKAIVAVTRQMIRQSRVLIARTDADLGASNISPRLARSARAVL